MQVSVENALPFGLGRVLKHYEGGVIDFQWLGNVAQSQNGRFQAAWYQDSVKKFYYKQHPIYKSHPPYTGKDLGVNIKIEDVILVDEETLFLENGLLKAWAKTHILNHNWVRQAVTDFNEAGKLD